MRGEASVGSVCEESIERTPLAPVPALATIVGELLSLVQLVA